MGADDGGGADNGQGQGDSEGNNNDTTNSGSGVPEGNRRDDGPDDSDANDGDKSNRKEPEISNDYDADSLEFGSIESNRSFDSSWGDDWGGDWGVDFMQSTERDNYVEVNESTSSIEREFNQFADEFDPADSIDGQTLADGLRDSVVESINNNQSLSESISVFKEIQSNPTIKDKFNIVVDAFSDGHVDVHVIDKVTGVLFSSSSRDGTENSLGSNITTELGYYKNTSINSEFEKQNNEFQPEKNSTLRPEKQNNGTPEKSYSNPMRTELGESEQNRNLFDEIMQVTLRHEGGYSDHKDDKGGKTYKGWTLDTFRMVTGNKTATIEDLRRQSERRLKNLYKKEFFDKGGVSSLPKEIVGKIFDMNVNFGSGRMRGLFREALQKEGVNKNDIKNTAGLIKQSKIVVDKLKKEGRSFVNTLVEIRNKRYREIVKKDPSQKTFLKGWLKRSNSFRKRTPKGSKRIRKIRFNE